MMRIVMLAVAGLLVLTACEKREEDVPAEVPRQTTPTPLDTTAPQAPAAEADPAQTSFPAREEVDLEEGQQVYDRSCASCHEQGIAGAPARGDQQQWEARLEKGYDALVANSIAGYQGEAGVMPPRGGNPDLSDEEVAAAVAYMMEMNP